MATLTKTDFLYFQNEILKDMKKLESDLNKKIELNSSNSANSLLVIESKLEKLEKNLAYTQENFDMNSITQQIKTKFSELNNKFEDNKRKVDSKLNAIQTDLSNACFKYDKIYINSISCPGLIGSGCPFKSMKDYLEFVNSKIKEMKLSKENNDLYIKKLSSILDNYKKDLFDFKSDLDKNFSERIKHYDNRTEERVKTVEDKLEYIRIENGRYNHNLNRKWQELVEKLESFYITNDNILYIYNNCRKEFLDIKKKFNAIYKLLSSSKYQVGNNKTIIQEIGKILGENSKSKKKKDKNKKNNIVLPSVTSLDEFCKIRMSNIGIKKSINTLELEYHNSRSNYQKKKSLQVSKMLMSNLHNFQIDGYDDSYGRSSKYLDVQNFKNLKITYEKDLMPKKFDYKSFKRKNTQKIKFTKENYKKYYNNFIKEGKIDEKNSSYDSESKTESNKNNDNEIQTKETNVNNDMTEEKNNSVDNVTKDNVDQNENLTTTSNIESATKILGKKFSLNEEKIQNLIDNKLEKMKGLTSHLDQELLKFDKKFDNLYEKSDLKIKDIVGKLNGLISQINKVVFQKSRGVDKIGGINLLLVGNKKNVILHHKEKYYLPPNEINDIKEFNKAKKNMNITNFNSNRAKSNEGTIKKYKIKDLQNEFIMGIDPTSINKIESFLVKKFTEPS